jgi:hypothetical protein
LAAAAVVLSITTSAFAASPAPSGPQQAIDAATRDGKLIYVLFYKDNDPATKIMSVAIDSQVTAFAGQTTCTLARVDDPAERAVAKKFEVTRAPLPLVIAVHPNGAVTGAFYSKVTEANLTACIVTPHKAECMKALQENQLVLLCIQNSSRESLPQGVNDFQTDPHFSSRLQVVTMNLSDPTETTFLASLEIDPKRSGPTIVFMAPPGVMIGKFAASASKDDLAAKLAAAGKCCDDKNCKHNQPQTTK